MNVQIDNSSVLRQILLCFVHKQEEQHTYTFNSYSKFRELEHKGQGLCAKVTNNECLLVYRGVSDKNHNVIPSICLGNNMSDADRLIAEQKAVEEFRERTYHILEQYKYKNLSSEIFYMLLARHVGLKCRLIDWSKWLNVAMSFALHNNSSDIDAAIYVLLIPKRLFCENLDVNPFSIERLTYYEPWSYWPRGSLIMPLSEARRMKQCGVFTIQSQYRDLEYDDFKEVGIEMAKIIIPSFLIPEIKDKGHMEMIYNENLYPTTAQIDDPLQSIVEGINSKYFK